MIKITYMLTKSFIHLGIEILKCPLAKERRWGGGGGGGVACKHYLYS